MHVSGALPEEGSPPPSSPPDTFFIFTPEQKSTEDSVTINRLRAFDFFLRHLKLLLCLRCRHKKIEASRYRRAGGWSICGCALPNMPAEARAAVRWLVPEMALSGEDHSGARFIDGFDGFLVAHRAAGLDDRGD